MVITVHLELVRSTLASFSSGLGGSNSLPDRDLALISQFYALPDCNESEEEPI
jgi:hypothetical protein